MRKSMRKSILVFCASLFLIMAFSGSSLAYLEPAPLDFEDLFFDGDFLFDINGTYSCGIFNIPLNVSGSLKVSSGEGEEELGNLKVMGQKNLRDGVWDGTYFGDWVYYPVGCNFCDYEIGILSDVSQFGENMLRFTLDGFNEALGEEYPDEIPRIEGSLGDEGFKGSPVPLPASVLLFGSGLIGFIGLKRRRR